MISYFFYQNTWLSLIDRADKINFLYHINLFDWPTEHGHQDYWEFTIVTNGALENHANGRVRVFGANSVLVATTRDVHFLLKSGPDPVRYINIMVRESHLRQILSALSPGLMDYLGSENFQLTLPVNRVNEIEQILLQVTYSNPDRCLENDKLTCSAFLLLISSVLLSQATDLLNMPPSLLQLNQLTQQNELLHCNVNDLAKKLGYSRARLTAIFRKYIGITPHRYLTEYKFNHARKLLETTTMTVSKIAETVGYSSTMQFFANFKRLFGITPSEYRKAGHPPISRPDRSGSRNKGGRGPGRPKKTAPAKKTEKQTGSPLPPDRDKDESPTEKRAAGTQGKDDFLPADLSQDVRTEDQRENISPAENRTAGSTPDQDELSTENRAKGPAPEPQAEDETMTENRSEDGPSENRTEDLPPKNRGKDKPSENGTAGGRTENRGRTARRRPQAEADPTEKPKAPLPPEGI